MSNNGPERFPALPDSAMTPSQRSVLAEVLAGPRKGAPGPFKAMLRSPGLMEHAHKLGAYVRFESSIPPRLNELAILLTARHWTAQFEWYAHARLAQQAGLGPAVIDAIRDRRRPDAMAEDETAVYDFTHALLSTGSVSDGAFAAVTRLFGERGVIDLTGAIGYYSLVSMILNVDRTALPAGEAQPLVD
jgi:4-carboxymuconolactone decarboxylase